MDKQESVLFNGKLVSANDLNLMPSSSWVKHCPGFYESIKVSDNKMFLTDYHYDRMMEGARYWNVSLPSKAVLFNNLQELIDTVPYHSGKLRLQFCVDVQHDTLDHIAYLEEGNKGFTWQDQGWITAVFKDHFKPLIPKANLKSNSRDVFLLAHQWMRHNELDEAIILNEQGKIVESTICNIWWVEDDVIYTPPLDAGCVQGVMRRFLLERLADWNFQVGEENAYPSRLEQASEIFLTNAIRGIRWVSGLDSVPKDHHLSYKVFEQLKAWELQQYR